MPLFKLSETGIVDQDNMVVPDVDTEDLFNDTELSDDKKENSELFKNYDNNLQL